MALVYIALTWNPRKKHGKFWRSSCSLNKTPIFLPKPCTKNKLMGLSTVSVTVLSGFDPYSQSIQFQPDTTQCRSTGTRVCRSHQALEFPVVGLVHNTQISENRVQNVTDELSDVK